jgi:short-subunit dehydrogenase
VKRVRVKSIAGRSECGSVGITTVTTSNDKQRLIALITGASTGIGVDLAECFARDGYDLILTARTASALGEVAERLATRYGIKATPIALDLGEIGGGTKLAEAIAKQGLHVDVLVNNAGYGYAGAFADSDSATQLGMIDLNDRALVELTHLYWRGMLASGHGGVLNVASTAAFQPGPLMAIYYASKAFVLSFSEALWEEARGTGVHVSCLCPGPTVSKFRARAGTDKKRLARAGAPMSSASVAQLGYRAWKNNKRVEVTGLRNRVVAAAVPFLPRAAVLGMVRSLQSPL